MSGKTEKKAITRSKADAAIKTVMAFLGDLPDGFHFINDNGSEYGEDWSILSDGEERALVEDWANPPPEPKRFKTMTEAISYLDSSRSNVTKTTLWSGKGRKGLMFHTNKGERVMVKEPVEEESS